MALYPEVFKHLQEEVDHVVGHGRLPSFADRPYLPYVSAVIKETFRWQTALPSGTPLTHHLSVLVFCRSNVHTQLLLTLVLFVPTAIPHVTSESDIYKGYYIPKGAIIVPDVWYVRILVVA